MWATTYQLYFFNRWYIDIYQLTFFFIQINDTNTGIPTGFEVWIRPFSSEGKTSNIAWCWTLHNAHPVVKTLAMKIIPCSARNEEHLIPSTSSSASSSVSPPPPPPPPPPPSPSSSTSSSSSKWQGISVIEIYFKINFFIAIIINRKMYTT